METAGYKLSQGRAVRFADFAGSRLEQLFIDTGLRSILGIDTIERRVYPRLVRLFDAKLRIDTESDEMTFHSEVKGVSIEFTDSQFASILDISVQDGDLGSIDMVDIDILSRIHEDPHHIDVSWRLRLTPLARLVMRVLQHNIFLKMGSFDQVYPVVRRATYAIFGGIAVNWARVLMAYYSGAVALHRSTIIYCHYLTRVFGWARVPLEREISTEQGPPPLGASSMRKMGISIDQIQEQQPDMPM